MSGHRIVCVLAGLMWASSALGDPGLSARFGDGKHTITTSVLTPAFTLKENESVHPQVAPAFTANYEGSLKVLRRATYTFAAAGAKLSIDGKEVAGPVQLDAGDHPLAIGYGRKPGAARLQVTWASDAFIAEPLPASVLSHAAAKGADAQAVVERGRMVVEERNCVGCHKGGGQGVQGRVGPDLTNIGGRTTAAWIYKWLENPKHFRAAAVMPTILAKAEDRRDVAAYLATLKDARRKGTDYKASASKQKQGKELFESIGCANCHGEAGPSLVGIGSKMSIGALAAYLEDPLQADRSGRMPNIQMSKEESVALADHLALSKNAEYEGGIPDGADVAHGQQVVRTAGCLKCHTIEGDAGKSLPDARMFAALDKLDPIKGCLAENPPASAARYGLSAEDRSAAAAFLAAIKAAPLVSAAPAHEFARSVQKFNCAACHETDQARPASAEDAAEKLPPLANVGAKLKRDWINQVLTDRKARVRFWLKTRMPHFGDEVRPVADQAVAAAGASTDAELKVAFDPAAIALGQQLVGANDPKTNASGMGCVTCHSLREFKPPVAADATRGPELTLMSTRLRADFFRRWMHEPARIQAGTAMPNFFTDKSMVDADRTIDVLWTYASLGQSMPPPRGIKEKRNYTLIVTDEPIVSRCQVPDPAGTIVYGISVGLPGMMNYTFDAEHVMFRTAWQGGFLDMTGDWGDRGGNPVKVLGQRFYSQQTFPIRIGDSDAEVPRVFKGYELKDKIPTFIYTVGGVEVRERITAVENGGLARTFEMDPGDKTVYFAATDEPGTTLSIPNGELQAMQVQKSFKSPEKVAGRMVAFPPAGHLTFAIVVRPK